MGDPQWPGREIRVLLVEHKAGDAQLLQRALGDAGGMYRTLVARTLVEAEARLAGGGIDVVLLDLALPDSEAAESIARLRRASAPTAIVALIESEDERSATEAIVWGAESTLLKSAAEAPLLSRAIRAALERRRQLFELEQHADAEQRPLHDPLTQLPGRVLFMDRLEQAVLAASRTGRFAAVLCIGVGRLSDVQSSLGREAAEALLCESGRRMRDLLRASDTVARLGADEFAVLLTHLAQPSDAERLAVHLHECLREPIALGTQSTQVELSIGVAVSSEQPAAPADLLSAALAARERAQLAASRIELAGTDSARSVLAPRHGAAAGAVELRYAVRVSARSGLCCGVDAELLGGPERGFSAERGGGRGAEDPEREERVAQALAQVAELLLRDLRGLALPGPEARVGIAWPGARVSPAALAPLAAAGRELGVPLELCVMDRRFFHAGPQPPSLRERIESDGLALSLRCSENLEQLTAALRETQPRRLRLRAASLGEPEKNPVDVALIWGLSRALRRLGIEWLVEEVSTRVQADKLAALGCPTLQGPLLGAGLHPAELAAALGGPPPWQPASPR